LQISPSRWETFYLVPRQGHAVRNGGAVWLVSANNYLNLVTSCAPAANTGGALRCRLPEFQASQLLTLRLIKQATGTAPNTLVHSGALVQLRTASGRLLTVTASGQLVSGGVGAPALRSNIFQVRGLKSRHGCRALSSSHDRRRVARQPERRATCPVGRRVSGMKCRPARCGAGSSLSEAVFAAL